MRLHETSRSIGPERKERWPSQTATQPQQLARGTTGSSCRFHPRTDVGLRIHWRQPNGSLAPTFRAPAALAGSLERYVHLPIPATPSLLNVHFAGAQNDALCIISPASR
eukprot:203835-Pleurochrysis_carterae.AAC.2